MKTPTQRQPNKRRAAKKAAGPGRPTKYTPAVRRKILEGLAKGTPLTILCEGKGMPGVRTVYDWMDRDREFSADIARAREAGFDRIALDALAIADEVTERDSIETKFGEIPNKEWILRSKLRVETRLKLLAKWDPKRYGERLTQEISGPGGAPIQTQGDFRPTAEDEEVIRRIAETRAKLKRSGEDE